jgi:hypothetical protein
MVPNSTTHTPLTLPERLRQFTGGITAATVATFAGMSPVSIYRLAAKHIIPSYRAGTSLRFDPEVIAQWLEGRV